MNSVARKKNISHLQLIKNDTQPFQREVENETELGYNIYSDVLYEHYSDYLARTNQSMFVYIDQSGDAHIRFIKNKEGEESMDWQEKYIDKLDRDVAEMKSSLRDTENRIAQMINQTLSEMRDRDNQRHQEFLALNTKLDQKVDGIEQKIDEVRKEIKEDRKWIIGIAIATIVGIAGMVITVLVTR